ncbi:MAG: dipeptidase [Clostridia bacterium]|nr:dipeptidase [Clostridia bacterium]
MFCIDMHCDTMVRGIKKPLRDSDLCASLEKLKAGNGMAQFYAFYIPKGIMEWESESGAPLLDQYNKLLNKFRNEMEANSDIVAQARTPDEILANSEKGLVSAVISLEDAFVIQTLDSLDRFYADGVRCTGLTWNYENQLAYPNSRDPELMAKGLKPFGFDVVEKCNQLGIAIDVSHLSDGGFYDVARHSKKPFIATHSNARALAPHPRNLTDDMLKVLGEKGGVTGLNFCDRFLKLQDPEPEVRIAYIEDMVRHAIHITNVAGIDALGFGSDFDGISNQVEFENWTGMPRLVDALSKHFTESQLEKICHKNVLRVLGDIQSV